MIKFLIGNKEEPTLLGYDQTLIKLEGTIKSMIAKWPSSIPKTDAKYKNRSTDKSEVTALDFFITGSF